MKRTLLIAMLLALSLVGGAVSSECITILRVKVLPLQLPTPAQGDQPFTKRDIVFIGDKTQIVDSVVEAREITLWCGGYALSISPVTSVAHITYSWTGTVRARADIKPHSIVVGVADGTMRIDRDNNTYSLWLGTDAPKLIGTCTPLP